MCKQKVVKSVSVSDFLTFVLLCLKFCVNANDSFAVLGIFLNLNVEKDMNSIRNLKPRSSLDSQP